MSARVSTPRAMLITLLAALVIGCGGYEAPSASPGGMDDVIANLVLRGATISQQVSGDAGCTGSPLHSNAVRLELTLAADGQDYRIYLFRWRRQADYDAAAPAFADCITGYEAAAGADVGALEVPPWRAFGPGWTERLSLTLEQALRATGGG